MEYPDSANWYLRAFSGDAVSEVSEGTAVAVRLRHKPTELIETFLLTCAHVVRRNRDSQGNLGRQHGCIRALPAGVGYGDGHLMEIVESVIPLGTVSPDGFYEHPVNDRGDADWVLLRFKDEGRRNLIDRHYLVADWAAPSVDDQCLIGGYPGGHAAFSGYDNGNDNNVRPQRRHAGDTTKTDLITQVHDGLITLDGQDSRPGMSGGGLFRINGNKVDFVGIHRARHDAQLQLKAVSAETIRLRLDELGYEPSHRSVDLPPAAIPIQNKIDSAIARLRTEVEKVLHIEPTRKFILTKNTLDPGMQTSQLADQIFSVQPEFRESHEYSSAMCYLHHCTLGDPVTQESRVQIHGDILRLCELLAPICFRTSDDAELSRLVETAINHAKVATDQPVFAAARAARFLGLKADLTPREVIIQDDAHQYSGPRPRGEGKLHLFGSPPLAGIEDSIVQTIGRSLQSILSAPSSKPAAIRGQLRGLSKGQSYVCLWINRELSSSDFRTLKKEYPDVYFLYSGAEDDSELNWLVYSQIQDIQDQFGSTNA